MSQQLNLLPPLRRRMLSRQSLVDNGVHALKNIAYGLGVAVLGMLLLVFALRGLTFTASRNSQSELDQQVKQYQEIKQDIEGQNEVYALLQELQGRQVRWSEYMTSFLQALPPGLTIEKLAGEMREGVPRITFSGTAVNRNTLIVLQDRFLELPWVLSVEAPHANLIDRVNPSYIFYVDISTSEQEDAS